MTGIIGAMAVEVNILKSKMTDITVSKVARVEFYEGYLCGKKIVVAESGIGKVNAAVCTQIMIDKYNVSSIINTGVAGAIDSNLNICDVVVSTDLMEHDFDVTAFGYNIGVVAGMDVESFVSDNKLVQLATEVGSEVLGSDKIKQGRIATGDQFIGDDERKKFLKETIKASCVEMEGAAIAHSAYVNGVPFVVIRSISDTADGHATIKYDEFVEVAAQKSSEIVEGMLLKM